MAERRSKPLSVLVTPREGELIEEIAHRAGESVSSWSRRVLLREAAEAAKEDEGESEQEDAA